MGILHHIGRYFSFLAAALRRPQKGRVFAQATAVDDDYMTDAMAAAVAMADDYMTDAMAEPWLWPTTTWPMPWPRPWPWPTTP